MTCKFNDILTASAARSWQVLCALVWLTALLLVPAAAQAQTATYTRTDDSATNGINDAATPCNNYFTRTFTVAGTSTVTDVNIGVLAAHTYRGDLLMYLVGPDGTRVQLANGQGAAADNYNVLFDDSAPTSISNYTASNNNVNSTTTVPPFAETYRPTAVLSAFNGKPSVGTWTFQMCDRFAQDSGTFYQADLILTTLATNTADLSLTKTRIGNVPTNGGTVTWRLSATSASGSLNTASGVVVKDTFPAGFNFSSSNDPTNFNASTGQWNVGSLAPGQTKTIDITGTITATPSVVITNTAEIIASSRPDPDSTVNNGVTTEDDYATNSFTVAGIRTPGVIPALSCPGGTSLFDWDLVNWTDGDTSNSYPVTDIGNVSFGITKTGGVWQNNNTFGGQNPALSTNYAGGFLGNQLSLHQFIDFATINETATTTITLPVSVPGLQFTISDVDWMPDRFADKLTVYGLNGATTVYPTLTNGVTNYIVGNTANGDITTGGQTADGNVTITFAQQVDTVVVVYGNHSIAPQNPGSQAVSYQDITFCKPVGELGITKISSLVSDLINGTTNPRAIPGATMEYCLAVNNTTGATVTDIVITDEIPATLLYTPASMTSGTNCGNATTPEDDDAVGTDDTTGIGASVSGATITAITASLAPSGTVAIKFRATIK